MLKLCRKGKLFQGIMNGTMNMNQGFLLAIYCGFDIHSASAHFIFYSTMFRCCCCSSFFILLVSVVVAVTHELSLHLAYCTMYIKWCEPLRECKWDLYPGIYTAKVDTTILFKTKHGKIFAQNENIKFLTILVYFCSRRFFFARTRAKSPVNIWCFYTFCCYMEYFSLWHINDGGFFIGNSTFPGGSGKGKEDKYT